MKPSEQPNRPSNTAMKTSPHSTLSRLALALLATAALTQQSVQAANATWKNGSATGTPPDWNTGTNWTGGTGTGGVPGTADIAVFDAVAAKSPNLSSSATIVELNFNNSSSSRAYDITATNSSNLTLTGTTAINAINISGNNTFDVPLIFGAASGTQVISVGNGATATNSSVMTFGTGTGGGGITINSGLTLNVGFTATSTGLANYATINLNSVIASTGAITLGLGSGSGVSGIGTFNVNGINTYSGTTTLGGSATYVLGNKSAFGTSTVNLAGTTQAATDLSGPTNKITNTSTITGTPVFQGSNNIELGGAMNANGRTITNNISGAALSISGNVGIFGTDAANKIFSIAGSGNTTISGIIDDNQAGTHTNAGALTYSGTGTLTLTGSNTFIGTTTISSGTISVSSLNSVVGGSASSNLGAPTTATNGRINFGAAGPITGTLLYTGAGETTDRVIRLVGNGVIQNNGGSGALNFTSAILANQGTPVTLTLGGSNTGNNTIGGAIPNATGITTSVTKADAGKWIFSGNNTYTGATAVTAGTLVLSGIGTVNTSSAINVSGGAKLVNNSSVAVNAALIDLAGSGTGSRAVLGGGILGGGSSFTGALTLNNIGDTLSPGNSPGVATFNSGQTWGAFSYDWETNNFVGTTAGTDFDTIAITGGLSLTGGSGSYQLNLLSLTAGNVPGNVGGFTDQARTWNILTTTTGITGFNALNWTLNTTGFTSSPAFTGSFSLGVAGNNLVLSYAVPEPATWALLAFSLTTVMVMRRRRG